MKRSIRVLLSSGALALTVPASAALVYSSGHGDIGVAYEEGELHLHFHIEEGWVGGSWVEDEEFEPSGLRVLVPEGLRTTLGGSFPLLGGSAGDSVWILPESDPVIAPHLGWATEELSAGQWAGDLRFSFALAGGPAGGEFAIWQASGLVGLFSTVDATAPGYFDLAAEVHDHFTMGFTAPGLWEIEVTVSGTHLVDGAKSATETFTFLVVPEPSSAVLAGLGALGLVMRRRR